MKSCSRLLNNVIALAVITIMASAVMVSCRDAQFRYSEGMIWHTAYHVTYESDHDLTDSIAATLEEVGKSLNYFDPGSLLSRVNTGNSVEVDQALRDVYEASRRINAQTGGAFDPTLGPLITAWGFGKGHKATADTARVDSLLKLVGITRTRLDNGHIVKDDDRIEFNFSAIAKGYGVDKVADMLARNGVKNYLVEIGGEIRADGKSPSNEDWRVGIDRPVYEHGAVHETQAVISFTGRGLATSGNYRNFQTDGEQRYGHTISATTGRPVRTDVLSASVVAPTCMEADALATSMMAMGSTRAIALADSLRLPVLLVLADSTVYTSPSMLPLIQ